MHSTIVGLLAAALMCGAQVADALIVYSVDVTDATGTETVTGTITTDGTIGSLVASDFIAWSFTAIGPVPFGPRSGATLVSCGAAGCGIIATATTLLVSGASGTDVSFPTPPGGILFGPGSFLVTPADASFIFHTLTSSYTIAASARTVPEPSTVPLLAIAFACLGFAFKRGSEAGGFRSGLVPTVVSDDCLDSFQQASFQQAVRAELRGD